MFLLIHNNNIMISGEHWIIISLSLLTIILVSILLYKSFKKEKFTRGFNPYENNGQCKEQIASNCQLMRQTTPHIFNQKYKSLQECEADPNQIPARCQPVNKKLYCEKITSLFGESMPACMNDPSLNDSNIPFAAYKCAYSAQNVADFNSCYKGQPPPL